MFLFLAEMCYVYDMQDENVSSDDDNEGGNGGESEVQMENDARRIREIPSEGNRVLKFVLT